METENTVITLQVDEEGKARIPEVFLKKYNIKEDIEYNATYSKGEYRAKRQSL